MTRKQKKLMRIAVAIHDQIRPKQCVPSAVELPTFAWKECQTLLGKMKRALGCGFPHAAQSLQSELRQAVSRLQSTLADVERQLIPPTGDSLRATAIDIHADLMELHEEFKNVAFDKRAHTLSVTTEPIELEGIYLGPFEIQLDRDNLLADHPGNYKVIAREPHPAESNAGVTHPHVSDEAVCEGEAHQPICSALRQGRLLDFFVIVRNLLQTYNPDSPFVSLAEWNGATECADCGARGPDEDDWWLCEKCEVTLCEGCYFICAETCETRCGHCVRQCRACQEHVCQDLVRKCVNCQQLFCPNCLTENERCSDCHDQETQEREDDYEETDTWEVIAPSTTANAAVQSDGLGQVALPT